MENHERVQVETDVIYQYKTSEVKTIVSTSVETHSVLKYYLRSIVTNTQRKCHHWSLEDDFKTKKIEYMAEAKHIFVT